MGLGSVATGLAIYKPVQFYWLTWICGGYHLARIIHFALTLGYVLFFSIHVIQVIIAGWNNFRSVVSGFEIVEESAPLVTTMIVEESTPLSTIALEEKISLTTHESDSKENQL